MCKTTSNFERFDNTANLIFIVRNIGNDDLNIVCHTKHGAHHRSWNFEKSQNVQNKQIFRKVSKRSISYIHSLRSVENDDVNSVWYSEHGGYHRSRNFVNAKMCKTNSNIERCENPLNLIYIVRNIGNDDLNIVWHSWHDAYHRSRNFLKAKMCKTNNNFEKFQNAVNLIYTVYGVLEMMM